METPWYHYIYKITCSANGMVYYGVHSTKDLKDGYMGSGAELGRAKKLYGQDAFHKEILCWCDSRQKALEVEALIVHKDDQNNYNRKAGGTGGLSSCDMVFAAGEPGGEQPLAGASDPLRECFGDMRGNYAVEDLWQAVRRDPHWHASFPGGIKEFKAELQLRGIYDPARKGKLKCRL